MEISEYGKYFDYRADFVLRVLGADQRNEIRYRESNFDIETSRLIAKEGGSITPDKQIAIRDVVSDLAMQDFSVARNHSFPAPTPGRAMDMMDDSKSIVQLLRPQRHLGRVPDLGPLALALTCLHWSFLGTEDLVRTDPSPDNLRLAAFAHKRILFPVLYRPTQSQTGRKRR